MRLKTPTEGSAPKGSPEDIPFIEAIRKALVNGATSIIKFRGGLLCRPRMAVRDHHRAWVP